MTSATIGNTRLPSKRVIWRLRANSIRPAVVESATARPRIAAGPGAMSDYWPSWPIPITPNTQTRSIGSAESSTRTSSISHMPTPYWLLDSEPVRDRLQRWRSWEVSNNGAEGGGDDDDGGQDALGAAELSAGHVLAEQGLGQHHQPAAAEALEHARGGQ